MTRPRPHRFTLFVGDKRWRIAAVHRGRVDMHDVAASFGTTSADDGVGTGMPNPAPANEPSPRAAAAAELLRRLGHAGEPIVLALSSDRCLCAMVSTADLERTGRRRAMLYRLEEHLPIAAEQLVADFIDLPGERALAVAAEHEPLGQLIGELERVGIAVGPICPMALLAAARSLSDSTGPDAILVASDDSVTGDGSSATSFDWIEASGGRIECWHWLADDSQSARDRVAAWLDGRGGDSAGRPVTIGPFDESIAGTGTGGAAAVDATADDPLEAAALAAAVILDGDSSPAINLRRDRLAPPDPLHVYRRPAAALVAAVAVLLAAVCAAAHLRAAQYRHAADDLDRQQAGVFKELFPDQRTPPDVPGRLTSERRKLAALGGRGGDAVEGSPVSAASALDLLEAVLAGLPGDVRYRILDLTIDGDRIDIEGQARTLAEAERIATSLAESSRFTAQPRSVTAIDESSVRFTITATPRRPSVVAGVEQ